MYIGVVNEVNFGTYLKLEKSINRESNRRDRLLLTSSMEWYYQLSLVSCSLDLYLCIRYIQYDGLRVAHKNHRKK